MLTSSESFPDRNLQILDMPYFPPTHFEEALTRGTGKSAPGPVRLITRPQGNRTTPPIEGT